MVTSDHGRPRVVQMRQRSPANWSAELSLPPGEYHCRYYGGDHRHVTYFGAARREGSIDCGLDALMTVNIPPLAGRKQNNIALDTSRASEFGQINVIDPLTLPKLHPVDALTFDTTKVPDTHLALLRKVDGAVSQWLNWAEQVPGHLLVKARRVIRAKYAMLSARYNPGFADAIIACGLIGLPIPVPGAVLIVAAPLVAAAELWRHFGKEKELAPDMAAVKKVAAEFWAETLALVDDVTIKPHDGNIQSQTQYEMEQKHVTAS